MKSFDFVREKFRFCQGGGGGHMSQNERRHPRKTPLGIEPGGGGGGRMAGQGESNPRPSATKAA